MFKILLIAVIIIVLGTLFAGFTFLAPKNETSKASPSASPALLEDSTEASESGTLLEQVKKIASEADTTSSSDSQNISTSDHIQLLEQTIVVLQKRLEAIEKRLGVQVITSSPTPQASTSTTTTKYPIYIPLGGTGNTNDLNFTNLEMFQISLDPADYPGYTSMQLEVNFKSNQNGGPTYVRLLNQTDNSPVASSDASGTSDKYTLITSGKFTLASGRKNYIMQAKNASNVETTFSSARIKVNF